MAGAVGMSTASRKPDQPNGKSPDLFKQGKTRCLAVYKGLLRPDRRVVLCTSLMYFLLNFTWYFLEVPTVRLLEFAVCQKYFRSHPEEVDKPWNNIQEQDCKISAIQSKVALVSGARVSLEALSSKIVGNEARRKRR